MTPTNSTMPLSPEQRSDNLWEVHDPPRAMARINMMESLRRQIANLKSRLEEKELLLKTMEESQ